MQFITAKKARLYPNQDTKVLLEKTFGCCRFVWNKLLTEHIKVYEEWKVWSEKGIETPKPKVDFYSLNARLTQLKKEYEWLNDVSSVALQQFIRNLATAFSLFFKSKKGFPQFKSKRGKNGFRIVNNSAIRLESDQVFLPKTKHATKFLPCYDIDEVSSYTIVKDRVGDYFINMVTLEDKRESLTKLPAIGIDLGITTLATIRDKAGSVTKIANPHFFTRAQAQRTKLSRRLAKKQKGSKNREKARIRLAKLERKIQRQRLDYLHKQSTKLINENQVICIEDLNVNGMLKNSKLAKHIADCGWSTFVNMLEYKAQRFASPKYVVKIDRFYPSSQTCSACNTKVEVKLKLSDRTWKCLCCNTFHDRDENAANNVLNQGLLSLAQ